MPPSTAAIPPSPFRVKRKPVPAVPIEEQDPSFTQPSTPLGELQNPFEAHASPVSQPFLLEVDLPLKVSPDASTIVAKPLPPRSPRRGTNYRGRSFSASSSLPPQNFTSLDTVCHQLSEEPLPAAVTQECQDGSPVPSLIQDLGSSEESGSEHNSSPADPSTPAGAFTQPSLPDFDDSFVHYSQISIPASGLLMSAPSPLTKAKLGRTGSIRTKLLEHTLSKLTGGDGPNSVTIQRSQSVSSVSPRRTLKRRREASNSTNLIDETSASVNSDVSPSQLAAAALLPLIDSSGKRHTFANIVTPLGVAVLFVRHWSCPISQSYVQRAALRHRPDQRFIIIGNGPHTQIDGYRSACTIPSSIEVFTEPSLRIHQALALGTSTDKDSHDDSLVAKRVRPKLSNVFSRAFQKSKHDYVHNGAVSQLGGEFHLESEDNKLLCTYVHRMSSSKEHGPLDTFLPNRLVPRTPVLQPVLPPPSQELELVSLDDTSYPDDWEVVPVSQRSSDLSERDKTLWMEERTASLRRMKERKAARRATINFVPISQDII
ncbi:hypothetical protein DL96DRAFT_1588088 [Flagelloscypha sp. PMI_526]|nr:hypothetical protein DL96DRAFT_1588088 [Flagelloscypha sp. PMI_526]